MPQGEAMSSGGCNFWGEELVEGLGWGAVVEGWSGAAVQGVLDASEVGLVPFAEVGALLEPEPQQPVRVLVRAALPGRVRVTEVHRRVQRELDPFVAGQLDAAVPGDRPAQVMGSSRIRSIIAVATSSAVCRPGRCNRITNRVDRSTKVPIADWLPPPMIRSPSQCPGTARSVTSAGRSLIVNASS